MQRIHLIQVWVSVFNCPWYCCKKQIECGLAWSVPLSTMKRIITVVKVLWTHNPVIPRQILTAVMTSIIFSKSTDHAKTTFDLLSSLFSMMSFSSRDVQVLKYANESSGDVIHSTKFWSAMGTYSCKCVSCKTISLPSFTGLRWKLAKIALFIYLI